MRCDRDVYLGGGAIRANFRYEPDTEKWLNQCIREANHTLIRIHKIPILKIR